MQLNTQDYLRLVERGGNLIFWDSETSSLNGDYGTELVMSFKRFGSNEKVYTITAEAPGKDKKLVAAAARVLAAADCWVTYYGKGFDVPMLNTRLLRWGMPPLPSRHHIDLYFSVRRKLKTGSGSQGHLLTFLESPEQKMTIAPSVWGELAANFKAGIGLLTKRCESDVLGLEQLYIRSKGLISEVKCG